MVSPNQNAMRPRRPVWHPSTRGRIFGSFRWLLKRVTFTRAVILIAGAPLLLYLYREVTRDTLIIDPFSVPKRFEESGLSGEVIANRVGDAIRQIENICENSAREESSP